MKPERELTLRPIGWVVEGPAAANVGEDLDGTSLLEIEPAWQDALYGIDGFSHIWVVWWIDQLQSATPMESLRIHPEGRAEMPVVGLFATRTPRRPNPIAITAVRLVQHLGRRVRVEGLDARAGTAVLDIKPYLRRGDLIPEATAPDWLERLWRIHDTERG